MNKIKSILHSVLVLASVFLLVSCASDDDDSIDTTWSSTSLIHSTSNLAESSRMKINSNSDIVIAWREIESEVRDNTELDTAHTFAGTVAASDSHATKHTHKDLFIRSAWYAKRYTAANDTWSSATQIATGYWQKSRSGTLAIADEGDNSKIDYDQHYATFNGDIALGFNSNGDALLTWIQLTESETVADDAGNAQQLMASFYDSSTNTWSDPQQISPAETQTTPLLKNEVAVSLNADGSGHVVWTERDNSSNITNAYTANFADGAFTAASLLSDGQNNVSDISIKRINGSTGIASWIQQENEISGSSVTAVYENLMTVWYSDATWHTTPTQLNAASTSVNHYTLEAKGSDEVWMAWEQTDSIGMDADAIVASQFSGDISADLANGAWSTAVQLNSSTTSNTLTNAVLAVDDVGNAMVSWVESDTTIRANAYNASNDAWLDFDILVTTNSVINQVSTIGGNSPDAIEDLGITAQSTQNFLFSWQNWQGTPESSGLELYSVGYNPATGSFTRVKQVSSRTSPSINGKMLYSKNGNARLLWSSSSNGQTDFLLSEQ